MLCNEHQVSPEIIESAFDQAQSSLIINWEFLRLLEHFKKVLPKLRIYVVSNIAKEHFDRVQRLPIAWSIFTDVFTSSGLGMRKPDLCFFRRVVDDIGGDVGRMVFVDDQPENLCAAQSLGLRGILARRNELPVVYRLLRNLLGDPLSRALLYLSAHAGKHDSFIIERDMYFKDNFSQLLIWDLTENLDLVYLKWPLGIFQEPSTHAIGKGPNGIDKDCASSRNSRRSLLENIEGLGQGDALPLWNYFCDLNAAPAPVQYPTDLDTTSVAYLTLPKQLLNHAVVDAVLDAMAENVSNDGIIQTYFTHKRPRACPIVCSNVLRVFYRFGRGDDARIRTTEDWVIRCLQTRACNEGTRHYTAPECFLYMLSLLHGECASAELRSRLEKPLQEALSERLHAPANPVVLAMRVVACQRMKIAPSLVRPDLESLLQLQEADGGWPAGHYCRMGSTGERIGNRGLTTALALKAIQNSK